MTNRLIARELWAGTPFSPFALFAFSPPEL